MRNRRALMALGVFFAVATLFCCVTLWRASRALRNSDRQTRSEGVIPFTSVVLDRPAPPGFETFTAPEGFRDAALFGDRVFIGGGGGLFEYDVSGTLVNRFRTGIELPAAPVVALATGIGGASAQELWIATAGEGALAYDGAHFRHIRPESAAARKMTAVLPLATGRILFGTAKAGVLAFDGKQLSPLHLSLDDAHVTALAGEESSLWIGTQDAGVLHWHAGQLDRYGEAEGLPDAHVFSIVTAGDTAYAATALGIAEIRDGRVQRVLARGFTVQSVVKTGDELIAGTLDEGIVRVPLEGRSKRATPEAMNACGNCSIYRVLAAGDATLALTAAGLFREESNNRDWKPVLEAGDARLADRNISAIAPGANGRLWIGYFDRGLDIFDVGGQRAQHIEDDAVFCVNRIAHDPHRDRTAVATSNGLVLFTGAGTRRQVLTRADGLIASQVSDVLFRNDGSMIAGTPAGVSFIEPSRISSIYAFHGLVNNHVYALGQVGERTLAGTLGGLSVIESGLASVSFTTANSGFKHNWITAILPAANDIFIGTYGGGIMHMGSGGAWTAFADLPASFEVNPNAMAASERAVYAGTLDRGLAVYSRAAGRWHWITRGLPSMNVTAIAVEDGSVYLGTDNGLVRVPEDNLLQ